MPKFELDYYDDKDERQSMVVEAESKAASREQCPSERINSIHEVDDSEEVTGGQGEGEPTSDEEVQAAAEAAEPGANE